METETIETGRYDKTLSDLTAKDVIVIGATLYAAKFAWDVVTVIPRKKALKKLNELNKRLAEKAAEDKRIKESLK